MARQNAINYLKRFQTDDEFRGMVFKCNTKADFEAMLEKEGLTFTNDEMDDAYTSTILKCKTQQEADDLKEVMHVFLMTYNQA